MFIRCVTSQWFGVTSWVYVAKEDFNFKEVTEDTNNLLLGEVTEDSNDLLLGLVTEDTNNFLLG